MRLILIATALAVSAMGEFTESQQSTLLSPLHENCTQNFMELLLLRQEMRLTDILSVGRETLLVLKNLAQGSQQTPEEPRAQKRTECVNGFHLVGGSCLRIVEEAISWSAARERCISLGADLATFRDANHFAEILGFVKYAANTLWIGARDEAVEGHWRWVTGEIMPLGPPFWGSYCDTGTTYEEPAGSTRENCAILYKPDRFYVHDTKCTSSAHALCQLT